MCFLVLSVPASTKVATLGLYNEVLKYTKNISTFPYFHIFEVPKTYLAFSVKVLVLKLW